MGNGVPRSQDFESGVLLPGVNPLLAHAVCCNTPKFLKLFVTGVCTDYNNISFRQSQTLPATAVAMASQNDKASESRIEHADMGTSDLGSNSQTAILKITRDSYWENRKAISMCLIISTAFLEFGLDQGIVNGFQVSCSPS